MNALEHADHTGRRKDLYEAKYPQTKKGGDKQSAQAKKLSAESALSFVKDTATKTNKSPRTVSQDVQISKNIHETVKETIRDTPLANQKTELLKMSRLPPDAQLKEGQVPDVRLARL